MAPKADDLADESLIELVKRYPALFDCQHKDFKNLHVREELWNEIASMLDKDVQSCKKRWRDIRDNYYKIRRKEQKNFSWGYGVKQSKWRLYDQLLFLPVVPRAANNLNYVVEENEAPSSIASSTNADESMEDARCPSPEVILTHSEVTNDWELFACDQKRRYISANGVVKTESPDLVEFLSKRRKEDDEEDDVDLFMRSVAITVKKLPPESVARAKMEILSIVTKLQFPSEGPT